MKMDRKLFKGTNELCVKCQDTCKQFENVTVVCCPLFKETDENKKRRLFKRSSEYFSKTEK